MLLKKHLFVIVLAVFCLAATLFAVMPINSQGVGDYDPWLDVNDDGSIEMKDVSSVARAYGTNGIPINKTDLLLELQTKVASLEARVDALEASTPLIIVAAGDIATDGTIYRSYNVDNVTWGFTRYEIEITGINYHYQQYVTLVTPTIGTTATASSSLGELNIYILDDAGNYMQGSFQFVTYRIP